MQLQNHPQTIIWRRNISDYFELARRKPNHRDPDRTWSDNAAVFVPLSASPEEAREPYHRRKPDELASA
jgi:hypothetical protein